MEENESFLFLAGVRITSAGSFWVVLIPEGFDARVKAGPERFSAGELRILNACRLLLTPTTLFPVLSIERGVKNLLNERGVTGGGFFGLRLGATSDAIEGGEDGSSCDEGGRTGSDFGAAGRPWFLSIA